MTPIELFLGLLFAGLSIIILIISIFASRRRKEFKFVMITVAFALCSIMALLSLLADTIGWQDLRLSVEMLVLNIGVVVSIYLAIMKG